MIAIDQLEMFGGGDYGRTVNMPEPVESVNANQLPVQNADPVITDEGPANMELPFMFGQVSNNAPGYDFSALFSGSKDPAPTSFIERVIHWIRSLLR